MNEAKFKANERRKDMNSSETKPWKGIGMNGWVARWYTRTRIKDIEDFRREAESVANRLSPEASILEIAPGPGFFSIELAKRGSYRITGLDVSETFVQIARERAIKEKVDVLFRHGNASAMPFGDAAFDFVYCSAAFKNFTNPIGALNEIHRVLRPGGNAIIVDLAKDASMEAVATYVNQSGRGLLDAWLTRMTFRHVLLKRAYTSDELGRMVGESRFGTCRIRTSGISLELALSKPPAGAAVAA